MGEAFSKFARRTFKSRKRKTKFRHGNRRSKSSKQRSSKSEARRSLSSREPKRMTPAPPTPKEHAPLRMLDWPIRLPRENEDPWLPGWTGPKLPPWILPIPQENPKEGAEPRTTTRTAYIRCLENRALKWHQWRYNGKRDFELRYGSWWLKESDMVAELNDKAYAQKNFLGDDWDKFEVIAEEPHHPTGPLVDGTVVDGRKVDHYHGRELPFWIFYAAGPDPYQWCPNREPEDVWMRVLKRRGQKWQQLGYPTERVFREKFRKLEPDGHGGRTKPKDE